MALPPVGVRGLDRLVLGLVLGLLDDDTAAGGVARKGLVMLAGTPPRLARGAGAERAVAPGELRRGERRGVGRLWLIVGVGVALVKADVLVAVLQHRTEVIAVLGLGLAFSVLRPQPVGIAVSAAAMLAFTLAPSSTLLGIALGLGAFVLLLALFIAIGSLLHARQDQDRSHA